MNSKKRPIAGMRLAWLLTLIYFASYITRKNFATVLQEVITDTGIAKETISVVLVCMTVLIILELQEVHLPPQSIHGVLLLTLMQPIIQ